MEIFFYYLYKLLHKKKLWPLLFFAGYALMTVICLIDFLTNYETRLSGLYIFPIIMVALVSELRNALLTVLIAVLIKGVSDLNIEGSLRIAFFNSLVTLFTYTFLVVLLIRFRDKTLKERKIAITDSLTGLYNLAGFYELAGLELAQSKRHTRMMSLIYFDCDKFKRINDQFGHSVGDKLLQVVACILKAELRETDYSFRWGGDEFVVLLVDTSQDEAVIVAKKLQHQLLKAMKVNHWSVTFSIGAATFVTQPETLDEMLVTADQLMYVAKQSGGNSIRYSSY